MFLKTHETVFVDLCMTLSNKADTNTVVFPEPNLNIIIIFISILLVRKGMKMLLLVQWQDSWSTSFGSQIIKAELNAIEMVLNHIDFVIFPDSMSQFRRAITVSCHICLDTWPLRYKGGRQGWYCCKSITAPSHKQYHPLYLKKMKSEVTQL
jgi:hypothetical protein